MTIAKANSENSGASGLLTSFVKSQYAKLPIPNVDLTGQTVIVTGANVGLGLETARHFARLNAARVILACRDTQKGEAARADIEATTERKGVVVVWQVDLNSYESVMKFCAQAGNLDRLDIVVENAGISMPTYQLVDGVEANIRVNVISTFLMAFMLLPVLRENAAKHGITPHLVIVSSDAHRMVSTPNIRLFSIEYISSCPLDV
jgi:retinol dehydrogenase 12